MKIKQHFVVYIVYIKYIYKEFKTNAMAHNINLNKAVRKMVMDSNLDSLMPVDCIEILSKHYGEKLKRYTPYVICVLVEKMMAFATDCEMKNEIADAVDTWCNDFSTY